MTTSLTFECPICYGSINLQDPHVKTKCNHNFCFDCYTSHQYSGNNFSHACPICRTQINPDPPAASPTPSAARLVISLLDLPIRDVDPWAAPPPPRGDWIRAFGAFSDRTDSASSQPAYPSRVLQHSRDSTVAQSPSHIHIPSPQTATSTDRDEDENDDRDEDEPVPSFILQFIRND